MYEQKKGCVSGFTRICISSCDTVSPTMGITTSTMRQTERLEREAKKRFSLQFPKEKTNIMFIVCVHHKVQCLWCTVWGKKNSLPPFSISLISSPFLPFEKLCMDFVVYGVFNGVIWIACSFSLLYSLSLSFYFPFTFASVNTFKSAHLHGRTSAPTIIFRMSHFQWQTIKLNHSHGAPNELGLMMRKCAYNVCVYKCALCALCAHSTFAFWFCHSRRR